MSQRTMRVTKSYSRKLNLRGVSSRYDNIELGTYISAQIDCVDEEDFNRKSNSIAQKARIDTERDLHAALMNLVELSKDKNNSALLGTGEEVEITTELDSLIAGFSDIVDGEPTTLPSDIKEVDIENA